MADDRNERVKEYSSPEKFQKPQYGSIEDMKKVSRSAIITFNGCHMEDYHACKKLLLKKIKNPTRLIEKDKLDKRRNLTITNRSSRKSERF